MHHPLPNYVRAHRKRAGLTQDELAFLLGSRFGTKVARYERYARQPTLRTVLALEVIFDVSAGELLHGTYREVEGEVIVRALALSRQFERARPTVLTKRKRQFLSTIIARQRAGAS